MAIQYYSFCLNSFLNLFLSRDIRGWNIELTLTPRLEIKLRKYPAGKYVWHRFWKDKTSWWGNTKNEWLYKSSRPKGFSRKVITKNFAKFVRIYLCQTLMFVKVRRCRTATSLKRRLQHLCFVVNITKFVRTLFLQTATGWLFLIIAVSLIVKWELANESVNYDTKIKEYQFEPELSSYQKGQSWWKNKFNSCFRRRSPEQYPVQLSAMHTKISWKNYLLPRKPVPLWQSYRREAISDFFILLNLLAS